MATLSAWKREEAEVVTPGGLLQLTMAVIRTINRSIKYLFILFRVLVSVSKISKTIGLRKREGEKSLFSFPVYE